MAQPVEQERDQLIAAAADWLARLDAGRVSLRDLDEWRDADPRRAAAFAEVAATWNRLDALRLAQADDVPTMTRRSWLKGAAAAAIAVSVSGLAYFERDYLFRERLVTGVGERRTVTLPDGSSIELNTDTQFAWRFDREARKFWLSHGEAALNIVEDVLRPSVLITARGLIDLAAGRFNARVRTAALELCVLAGHAKLRTASGQIHVATASSAASQMLTIDERQAGVSMTPADQEHNIEAWRRGEIVFNGQSLAAAVEEFNRYLARKLAIEDPKVAELRLGGRFSTTDVNGFLTALHTTFGVRAVEEGPSRILLISR